MKKLTALIIFVLMFVCTVFCGCASGPVAGNTETLTVSFKNGTATVNGAKNVSEYSVYTGDNPLFTTKENSFDLARAIIDNRAIAFGKWKIHVEGLSADGKVLAKTEKPVDFEIRELNQENFYNSLKNQYDENVYFLLSGDVYLYGRTERTDSGLSDYQTVVFQSGDRADTNNNALFFVKNPFTATLDGNGYSLNVVVDQHINWASLPFVFGGIFNEIAQGAVVKNLQVFSDFVYEVKSRVNASASFVFKHYGSLENVFISQTNRPMLRPDVTKHDTDNYLDREDNRVAVISHAYNGASVSDCVFHTAVYNVAGDMVSGGGAVARSQTGVTYDDCVYVSETGEARFFNTEMDGDFYQASAGGSYAENARNIRFYPSLQDFLSGSGKKVAGNLTWQPVFTDFYGDPLESFSNKWSIEDGDLYLNDKQIVIY